MYYPLISSMNKASTPSIITSGLILNLDAGNVLSYSGSGTTWTDLSTSNYNGTLINGTGYSAFNGGTLTFDGTNDYVTVNSLNKTNLGNEFTLSLWFNSENTSAAGLFEISLSVNSGSPFILLNQNGTSLRWFVNFGYNITTTISNNTWYNVTLTYSSSQYQAYINGSLYASYTGGLSTDNGFLSIGSGYPTYSKEKVSIFQAYNRALNATEILNNFNVNKGRYGY